MSLNSKTHKTKPHDNERPFVFLNVATTADGKLAPPNRHFVPFSSRRDQDLLYELRTRADAVMAGARTVDSVPVNLGPGAKKYRTLRRKNGLAEYNLRVIVSGSGSINPRAEIFRHMFSPLIILVTQRASRSCVQRLEKLGAIVHVCGKTEINFSAALQWLRREWKVRRLLCEGGGEINDALLRANLVDEIYLTLCPTIFGGRTAPTLADGAGAPSLAAATQLKLKSQRHVGDEMFLCYSADTLKNQGGV
jgi:2,5-diamino-6-(ribosylamino)-4(3H)-pyrimidinone 5'-phosphate reductase